MGSSRSRRHASRCTPTRRSRRNWRRSSPSSSSSPRRPSPMVSPQISYPRNVASSSFRNSNASAAFTAPSSRSSSATNSPSEPSPGSAPTGFAARLPSAQTPPSHPCNRWHALRGRRASLPSTSHSKASPPSTSATRKVKLYRTS